MPKVLSEEQIDYYRENGYLAPFDAIETSEVEAMCDDLSTCERKEGIRASEIIVKGHLCFRRSYEFSRNSKILDVVEDLIGPHIYTLSSRFWMKPVLMEHSLCKGMNMVASTPFRSQTLVIPL